MPLIVRVKRGMTGDRLTAGGFGGALALLAAVWLSMGAAAPEPGKRAEPAALIAKMAHDARHVWTGTMTRALLSDNTGGYDEDVGDDDALESATFTHYTPFYGHRYDFTVHRLVVTTEDDLRRLKFKISPPLPAYNHPSCKCQEQGGTNNHDSGWELLVPSLKHENSPDCGRGAANPILFPGELLRSSESQGSSYAYPVYEYSYAFDPVSANAPEACFEVDNWLASGTSTVVVSLRGPTVQDTPIYAVAGNDTVAKLYPPVPGVAPNPGWQLAHGGGEFELDASADDGSAIVRHRTTPSVDLLLRGRVYNRNANYSDLRVTAGGYTLNVGVRVPIMRRVLDTLLLVPEVVDDDAAKGSVGYDGTSGTGRLLSALTDVVTGEILRSQPSGSDTPWFEYRTLADAAPVRLDIDRLVIGSTGYAPLVTVGNETAPNASGSGGSTNRYHSVDAYLALDFRQSSGTLRDSVTGFGTDRHESLALEIPTFSGTRNFCHSDQALATQGIEFDTPVNEGDLRDPFIREDESTLVYPIASTSWGDFGAAGRDYNMHCVDRQAWGRKAALEADKDVPVQLVQQFPPRRAFAVTEGETRIATLYWPDTVGLGVEDAPVTIVDIEDGFDGFFTVEHVSGEEWELSSRKPLDYEQTTGLDVAVKASSTKLGEVKATSELIVMINLQDLDYLPTWSGEVTPGTSVADGGFEIQAPFSGSSTLTRLGIENGKLVARFTPALPDYDNFRLTVPTLRTTATATQDCPVDGTETFYSAGAERDATGAHLIWSGTGCLDLAEWGGVPAPTVAVELSLEDVDHNRDGIALSVPEGHDGPLVEFTLPAGEGYTLIDYGDDAAFTVTGSGTTRVLRFTETPNYERPTDHDRNNVYETQLASDDHRSTRTVRVTVTDVDDTTVYFEGVMLAGWPADDTGLAGPVGYRSGEYGEIAKQMDELDSGSSNNPRLEVGGTSYDIARITHTEGTGLVIETDRDIASAHRALLAGKVLEIGGLRATVTGTRSGNAKRLAFDSALDLEGLWEGQAIAVCIRDPEALCGHPAEIVEAMWIASLSVGELAEADASTTRGLIADRVDIDITTPGVGQLTPDALGLRGDLGSQWQAPRREEVYAVEELSVAPELNTDGEAVGTKLQFQLGRQLAVPDVELLTGATLEIGGHAVAVGPDLVSTFLYDRVDDLIQTRIESAYPGDLLVPDPEVIESGPFAKETYEKTFRGTMTACLRAARASRPAVLETRAQGTSCGRQLRTLADPDGVLWATATPTPGDDGQTAHRFWIGDYRFEMVTLELTDEGNLDFVLRLVQVGRGAGAIRGQNNITRSHRLAGLAALDGLVLEMAGTRTRIVAGDGSVENTRIILGLGPTAGAPPQDSRYAHSNVRLSVCLRTEEGVCPAPFAAAAWPPSDRPEVTVRALVSELAEGTAGTDAFEVTLSEAQDLPMAVAVLLVTPQNSDGADAVVRNGGPGRFFGAADYQTTDELRYPDQIQWVERVVFDAGETTALLNVDVAEDDDITGERIVAAVVTEGLIFNQNEDVMESLVCFDSHPLNPTRIPCSQAHVREVLGGYDIGSAHRAEVTLPDDDTPIVAFGAGPYEVAEGGTVAVPVTLSKNLQDPVTIPVVVTTPGDNPATPETDFTLASSVTFNGAGTENVTVTALADELEETTETFTLSFGTIPAPVLAGTPATASVSIRERFEPPWTATLTVGGPDGDSERGFVDGDDGDLTPATFSYDGVTYTVTRLSVGSAGLRLGYTSVPSRPATDRGLPGATGLTLRLGPHELALDADRDGATAERLPAALEHPNYAKTLSDGATWAVCLRAGDQACPPAETAAPGTRLFADKSGIEDADGLPVDGYSYQWQRSSGGRAGSFRAISGATSQTYDTVAADAGKLVRARVEFADRAANDETRFLDPVAVLPANALWGGVLRAKNDGTGNRGYVQASDTGALAPRTFTYAGVDYTVNRVTFSSTAGRDSVLGLAPRPPASLRQDAVLLVGETPVGLGEPPTATSGEHLLTFDATEIDLDGTGNSAFAVDSVWPVFLAAVPRLSIRPRSGFPQSLATIDPVEFEFDATVGAAVDHLASASGPLTVRFDTEQKRTDDSDHRYLRPGDSGPRSREVSGDPLRLSLHTGGSVIFGNSDETSPVEVNGTVTATLAPGADYTVGASASATVEMLAGRPLFWISLEEVWPDAAATEGRIAFTEGQPGTVTVTARTAADVPQPRGDVNLTLNSNDGVAQSDVDYEAVFGTVSVGGRAADWKAVGNRFDAEAEAPVVILSESPALIEGDEAFPITVQKSATLPSWASEIVRQNADGSPMEVSRDSNGVTVQGIISDAPRATVRLASEAAEVFEGGSATITVDTHPDDERARDVTVSYTVSGRTPDAGTGTLTLAAGTDSAQIVVRTTDDTVMGHHTVTVTITGVEPAGIDGAGETLSFTVVDNDTPELRVLPVELALEQGPDADSAKTSGTFTVALLAAPSDDVTVAVGVPAAVADSFSVDPAALTFTESNYGVPKTVTVTALADRNAVSESSVLTLAASGGGYAGVGAEVAVSVVDSDPLDVIVTPTDVPVAEGGTAQYTVALNTEPTGLVTVRLGEPAAEGAGSGDTGDISAYPKVLEFSLEGWDEAQTVTVTAPADDDGHGETFTIEHTAAGGGYDAVSVDAVTVTVADDEAPDIGIEVWADTLEIAEGGTERTHVRLAVRPTRDVTLSAAATGTLGSMPEVSGGPLTFTPQDWDIWQTLMVHVPADQVGGEVTGTLTVTADANAPEYEGETATVSVRVSNDDPHGILLSQGRVKVKEGQTSTYSVVLQSMPVATDGTPGTVQIAISGDGGTSLEVTPSTLTFGTDWATPKTVTVAAANDTDDVHSETWLTHTASGANYTGESARLLVKELDKQGNWFVITPNQLSLVENHPEEGTLSYTVELLIEPTIADQRPRLTPRVVPAQASEPPIDHSEYEVTPTSMWFGPDDWNVPQEFTITALHDADARDDAWAIEHMVQQTIGRYETDPIPVTVLDDERPALVLTAPGSDTALESLAVPEGGEATIEVGLSAIPTGEVTVVVAVTGQERDGFEIPEPRLTFSPEWPWTWAPRTLTVRHLDDDDAYPDAATLAFTGAGEEYAGVTASLPLAGKDDDLIGVWFEGEKDVEEVTVTEGHGGDYSVRLASDPGSGTVMVAVAGHAGTAVTPSPTTLSFDEGNWDVDQTVTVMAADDVDTMDQTVTLTHAVSGTGNDYTAARDFPLRVTVRDDERPGFLIAGAPLRLEQGPDADAARTSGTFTVALLTAPTGPVEVTVGVPAAVDGAFAVNPAELTFPASDHATAQTVTVTALADLDADSERAELTLSGSGGGYGGIAGSVAVSVADSDGAGVLTTRRKLTMVEGDTATYAVSLAREPTGTVTVAVEVPAAAAAAGALGVDPTTLTFTETDYGVAQTVTVTALGDADAAGGTWTIGHAASGGGYDDAGAQTVTVTVTDAESPAIEVSNDDVRLNEDESATVNVSLVPPPRQDVTVRLSAEVSGFTRDQQRGLGHETYEAGYAPGGLVVEPDTLTFKAGDDDFQTVTLTAPEDDDAVGVRGKVTLAADAGAAEYAGVEKAVSVTAEDADVPGMVIEHDGEVIQVRSEDIVNRRQWRSYEGIPDSYTIRLNSRPVGDDGGPTTVLVTITFEPEYADSFSPVRLTFSDENWAIPQTVTYTPAAGMDWGTASIEDTDLELEHIVSGGEYHQGVIHGIVGDPDTSLGGLGIPVVDVDGNWVLTDREELELAEDPGDSNNSLSYRVSLLFPPTTTVTVTPRLAPATPDDPPVDETEYEISPESVTFEPDDWERRPRITVTAKADADAFDDAWTITHEVTPEGYAARGADEVAVTVEDQTRAAVTVTAAESDEPVSRLTVREGKARTVRVGLDPAPTAEVTVTVTKTGLVVPDTSDFSFSPGRLTFSPDRPESLAPQTLTVRHDIEDADNFQSDEVTLTLTPSADTYDPATLLVAAYDDEPGIWFNGHGGLDEVTVAEGAQLTYGVQLASSPGYGSDSVVVAVSGDEGTALTVSPDSLTFLNQYWERSQEVTVVAAHDEDTADERVTLLHTSAHPDYTTERLLHVYVLDDDKPQFVIDGAPVLLEEGPQADPARGSGTFAVSLLTAPTGPVTVDLRLPVVASQALALDRETLTFTRETHRITQDVTVTALEDRNAVSESAVVTLTATGGGYNGTTGRVPVLVTDSDDADVIVTPSVVPLDEGGTATYAVTLVAEPTGTVTVRVLDPALSADDGVPPDGGDISVSPRELTFAVDRWDEAQSVTVTAPEDPDGYGEVWTVGHDVAGGGYDGASASAATVAVNDDETPGIEVRTRDDGRAVPDPLELDEDTERTLEVRLATPPTRDVTVAVRLAVRDHAAAGLAASETSLTFTPQDGRDWQAVTLTAPADDDARDVRATVTFAADGNAPEYAGEDTQVRVSVDDGDEAGILFEPPASLRVAEGGGANYTVRLGSEPVTAAGEATTVTVTIAGHAGTDVGVSPETLTFGADWETPKTVAVTAATDADAVHDEVTLTHTAAGGDYDGETASLLIKEIDAEGNGIVATPRMLVLEESSDTARNTATYTVALALEPTGTVTVTPGVMRASPSDPAVGAGEYRIAPASLEFTLTDWSDAQTVTVMARQDEDALDEAWTIAHAVTPEGYAATGADEVAVTVTDDETADVRVTLNNGQAVDDPLPIPEGEERRLRVALGAEPSDAVEVTVTGHAGTEFTVAPERLSFAPGDWSAKTLRLSLAHDDDAYAENPETLTLRATGAAEFDGATVTVRVSASEDDELGVLFGSESRVDDSERDADDRPDVELEEGTRRGYRVRLASRPNDAVTVTVSGHEGSALSVAETVLTFPPERWNEPQEVTLAAAHDEDNLDVIVYLAHTVAWPGETVGPYVRKVRINDDERPLATASFASAPANGRSYDRGDPETPGDPGETIRVDVAVSEVPDAENVELLTLTLLLGMDGDAGRIERQMRYDPADQPPDPAVLRFAHTVGPDDRDDDGVEIGPLVANGATLEVEGRQVVDVEQPRARARAGHRVGVPEWSSELEPAAVVAGESATYTLKLLNNARYREGGADVPWPVALIDSAGGYHERPAEFDDYEIVDVEKAVPVGRDADGEVKVSWTIETSAKDEDDAEEETIDLVAVADHRGRGGAGQAGEFHRLTIAAASDDALAAIAHGDVLALVYEAPLDAAAAPAAADFLVEVNGVPRALTAVAVDGRRVWFGLAAPVAGDDRVTVSYPAPGGHPVRYLGGAPAGPLYRLPARIEAQRPDDWPVVVPGALPEQGGAGERRYELTAAVRELDDGDDTGDVTEDKAGAVSGTVVAAAGEARAQPAGPETAPAEAGDPAAVAAPSDGDAARAVPPALDGELAGVVDAALATALAEAFGTRDDPDIERLEALRAPGREIADLAGLERAAGLRELDLGANALTDLAPLAALTELRGLDLGDNALTDLAPLAGLVALRRLDLSGNAVADVTPLSGLVRLETLLLGGNDVRDVTPLGSLTGLVRLDLSGNPVVDVSALADLLGLRRLDLARTAVDDLSPVGDLTALVWVDVAGSPVGDAAPLWRLTALRWLFGEPSTFDWLVAPGREPRLLVEPAPPNREMSTRTAPSAAPKAP